MHDVVVFQTTYFFRMTQGGVALSELPSPGLMKCLSPPGKELVSIAYQVPYLVY